jgi:hypothetical protein
MTTIPRRQGKVRIGYISQGRKKCWQHFEVDVQFEFQQFVVGHFGLRENCVAPREEAGTRLVHRNLKSRSRIKPWKVKKIGRKSAQGMNTPKLCRYVYIKYCAMENCGGKIQFMIWSGALIPWALFPQTLLLLDFHILDFYGLCSVARVASPDCHYRWRKSVSRRPVVKKKTSSLWNTVRRGPRGQGEQIGWIFTYWAIVILADF